MKKFLRKLWACFVPVWPPYSPCCTERLQWIGPDELLAMGKERGFSTEQTIMATLFLGTLYRCPACKKIWEMGEMR